MKLVEMYYAIGTVENEQDYNNFIKRYESELNELNENIIINRLSVMNIRHIILNMLQDFNVREVLDQAETLFNDILRHENETQGKLSPTMKLLRDEAINIEKEYE